MRAVPCLPVEQLPSLRERVLEGALVSLGHFGLAKMTVDDVVRASGVSRATIYRHFPGGREQLVGELVAWETGRFFRRLGEAVAGADDLAALVEEALVFAHGALLGHQVLQRLLATEPERLLPLLTVQAGRVLPLIAGFLVPYVEREGAAGRLRPGVDVDAAGDYIARMLLSLVNTPGRWNLQDPDEVRSVVRLEVLGGVLTAGAAGGG